MLDESLVVIVVSKLKTPLLTLLTTNPKKKDIKAVDSGRLDVRQSKGEEEK